MATASYRSFTGTAAENYQRWFVPAIALPVSAGLLAAAELKPGERVADVACGTGVVARLAAERVGPTGAVTAIDLAPDMVEVARRTPAPEAPPIDWKVGDAEALPLPDAGHDVVLCQMGLMFMEDQQAALSEMRRIAAPGARIVVNTPGAIQPPFAVMEQAITRHLGADLGRFVTAVFSIHDPARLAALLRAAGWSDVSATVVRAPLRLPSPAEFLWQYVNLSPMGPLVVDAPEAAKEAVERAVVEGWQPYVVEGGSAFDQPIVVARGRRPA